MFLETKRLTLREFTKEDLDAFTRLIADPEVMRYSVRGPMKDREQVKEYLQKRILDHYAKWGFGLYAVISKENGFLIGFVGLTTLVVDGEEKIELGYRLHKAYWGKGLATEASIEVCHYAFDELGLKELISIIDPENKRSYRVAHKLGMHLAKKTTCQNISVDIYTLKNEVTFRPIKQEDLREVVENFMHPKNSFEDSFKKWNEVFEEHKRGIRNLFLIEENSTLIGYGSLLFASQYSLFKKAGIPEINSLWIKEKKRRQGLGKRLIRFLERKALKEGFSVIGIGVGLYTDYGLAQKLYFNLGYMPDGNGISYKGITATAGQTYSLDDELLLFLTKKLKADL